MNINLGDAVLVTGLGAAIGWAIVKLKNLKKESKDLKLQVDFTRTDREGIKHGTQVSLCHTTTPASETGATK